tara:strand:- start:378 stop:1007 length:630 start_codon:yes stop_codon:yes gene_type:complete
MLNSEIIFFTLLAYLTGAFPSAVWLGKRFYSIDVREFGSGNAGATNTFRVLGKKAGIPVLLMDIFKGWLSVNYINFLSIVPTSVENQFEIQLVFGVAAVIGHLFPIYTGFRGGKGIATLLGLLIALHFYGALFSIFIFILFLAIFRYVSLASIIASLTFPIFIILIFNSDNSSLNMFSFFVPLLSLITHQKNIERLVRGEETKIKFGAK